jgi:DNA invertase Pin-like site-specific DNA recombinase
VVNPQRYDDGGFSGGNIERPALKRLIDDIKAGMIDCVVVYKVDRLSRSLLDFARVMGTFDEHGVSFVSVSASCKAYDNTPMASTGLACVNKISTARETDSRSR